MLARNLDDYFTIYLNIDQDKGNTSDILKKTQQKHPVKSVAFASS